MALSLEKLVSRNVANILREELKLSGIRMTLERYLTLVIFGGILVFVLVPALLVTEGYNTGIAALAGFAATGIYELLLYAVLELKIEQRKNFVESVLPDYLQIVAANIRSGIAIDKSVVLAVRPEFGYFGNDIKDIDKELYTGITLQQAFVDLGKRYRSNQLQHTIRMIIEGIQYGGGMTDLLNGIAKDLRNQQMVQKEISGQLFLYTIFIAFAAIIGAPVLYALTSQMIGVTNSVWTQILKSSPGGLPTIGVSFLRPNPPQITTSAYYDFALTSVIMIATFASFIVSAISSGSVVKGIRLMPIFILVAVSIFLVASAVISGIFASLGGV